VATPQFIDGSLAENEGPVQASGLTFFEDEPEGPFLLSINITRKYGRGSFSPMSCSAGPKSAPWQRRSIPIPGAACLPALVIKDVIGKVRSYISNYARQPAYYR
jgi:hypothetical protein